MNAHIQDQPNSSGQSSPNRVPPPHTTTGQKSSSLWSWSTSRNDQPYSLLDFPELAEFQPQYFGRCTASCHPNFLYFILFRGPVSAESILQPRSTSPVVGYPIEELFAEITRTHDLKHKASWFFQEGPQVPPQVPEVQRLARGPNFQYPNLKRDRPTDVPEHILDAVYEEIVAPQLKRVLPNDHDPPSTERKKKKVPQPPYKTWSIKCKAIPGILT